MTAERLPVLARVLPAGCGMPGCRHHYHRRRREVGWKGEPLTPECVCVAWPADRGGAHLFAVNPLCQAHPTVLDILEAAAGILSWNDWLDPEADELAEEDLAELLDIYRAGPCEHLCLWFDLPQAIADHWIARRQRQYELAAPVWECACGVRYKCPAWWGNAEEFYHITADGLVGDRAGAVKRNSKGKATHSDDCPACGRRFADTIADQSNPQQALF
jgi:hypothetical protein